MNVNNKSLLALLVTTGFLLASEGMAHPGAVMSAFETQLNGNGNELTEDQKIEGEITSLQVNKATHVTLIESDEPSIQITGDSNLIPHMRTEVRNGTLVIEPTCAMNRVPQALVAVSNLSNIQISGASIVQIDGQYVSPGNVSIHLSGASRLTGSWQMQGLQIHARGASTLTLSGSSNALDLQATSASKIDLENLQNTGIVNADLRGASKASVSGGTLNRVRAQGASVLDYNGSCSADASKVNCTGNIRSGL